MGQRVVKFCDLDESHEATENVALAINGEAVEIDCCAADLKKITDGMTRLMKPGRSINVRDLVRRPTNGHGAEADPQIVRAWAQAKGLPIAEKGRVGEDIVAQWRAAGSPVTW